VHALLLTEYGFLCRETEISSLEDPLLLKLKTTIQIERRIVMWKKLLILSLCISVLFVFSAPISSVNAGGKWKRSKKINWQIAGTIVQFIDIYSPPAVTYVGPHSMINLSAQGSPGPAQITLLSMSGITHPTGKTFSCPNDYPNGPLYFVKNDFVAIFPDHSLLFASLDINEVNHLCFGSTGSDFGVVMNITGGTGRFEGASGEFTATGNGYFINPLGTTPSDNTLVGENGIVTGEINFD
jgi:hypothetical protein